MKSQIMVLLVFAIVLAIGYQVQIEINDQFVKYCDAKYGKGNWTVVVVYDPNVSLLSVCYKCVPKYNNSTGGDSLEGTLDWND